MRILPNNIAILDEPDQLCRWVEEAGRLCHDDGVTLHYLPQIKPGDVVIDAGAAIGDHTIAYAQATGNPANIHAFECNPKMLECLRHNCPGVHIYPFALSDRSGYGHFNPIEGNAGAGFCSGKGLPVYNGSISITEIALDDLKLEKVDFIKWDIEGFEYRAISGAANTLKRCRPRMIVEVYEAHLNRCGTSSLYLTNLITCLGYNVSILMGDPDEGRYEALCLPK